MKKHTYEVTILEGHLDSFGHVNNATYLNLFEEARWDMITSHGFGYEEIHKKKQGPVILEVNVKFKKELRIRQRIKIHTHLHSYTKTVGVLEQNVENEKGETCCTAQFHFGLFDMKSRRLIRPTEEWKEAIGMD